MPTNRLLVIASPDAPWLAPLADLPPDTEKTVSLDHDVLRVAGAEADVILNCTGRGEPLRAALAGATKLRWIHSLAAGVENQLIAEVVDSPVPLTNSRGVYKESLGEFVVAAMLLFAKDLRRMMRNQREHRWEQFDVEMLNRQTLGVVGYGEIGQAAARRAKALGMRVLAMRRKPETPPDADAVFPRERLHEMLSESHYVCVAAPLTAETRGMIGAAEFAVMRSDAVIMNVGRGPVIDEAAMVEALRSGRIRGAALDVFDQEPLPPDHPLWDFENVLISPHCADHIEGWLDDAVRFFVGNYRRYLAGEPLLNIVDKKAGY